MVTLALLVLGPADASADIYTFTDADGVMHFTNRRPADGRFKLYLRGADTRGGRASNIMPVAPSDHASERFTRYDRWIREAAALYQIPEALVRAVVKVESDYDPRAVSATGARGLMQLMPETGLAMQARDPFDPRQNIFAGTRYLRVLANTFNGDLELTIAGYNAGEAAVIRYGGIPPYEETQDYVLQVLRYYHRYRTMGDVLEASQG